MLKYFIFGFIIFLIFKIIQKYFVYNSLELHFKNIYIKYIDLDDPKNHFIKGCLAINFQNLILAKWHFLKAKNLVFDEYEFFNYQIAIDKNLQFCDKPLPWINKPIDKSGSTLFHILINLFGNQRMPNYDGIQEDLKESISMAKYIPMNLNRINNVIYSSVPPHLFK